MFMIWVVPSLVYKRLWRLRAREYRDITDYRISGIYRSAYIGAAFPSRFHPFFTGTGQENEFMQNR